MQSTGNATSNIRQFQNLADAVAFVSECIESNSALALFNQTVLSEIQAEQHVEDPTHFAEVTFPELKCQFRVMDFRM
jgi:hypothetical protein